MRLRAAALPSKRMTPTPCWRSSRLCSADTRGWYWSGCWAAGWTTPPCHIQTLVYAVEHKERQHRLSTAAAVSPSSRRNKRVRISRDFTFRYSATATVQAGCASATQSMSWRQRQYQRFSHGVSNSFLEGQPAQISVSGNPCDSSAGGDLKLPFFHKQARCT